MRSRTRRASGGPMRMRWDRREARGSARDKRLGHRCFAVSAGRDIHSCIGASEARRIPRVSTRGKPVRTSPPKVAAHISSSVSRPATTWSVTSSRRPSGLLASAMKDASPPLRTSGSLPSSAATGAPEATPRWTDGQPHEHVATTSATSACARIREVFARTSTNQSSSARSSALSARGCGRRTGRDGGSHSSIRQVDHLGAVGARRRLPVPVTAKRAGRRRRMPPKLRRCGSRASAETPAGVWSGASRP